MVRLLLVLLILCCGLTAQTAWAQVHLWSHRYGGVLEDLGRGVAVDHSGNVFVSGIFSQSIDFGGGSLTSLSSDNFAAKFDSNGDHVWSQKFGELVDFSLATDARGVAVDGSGNVILTSHNELVGGFLAKLDTNGDPLWSHQFCCAIGLGVEVDGDDNVIVTGSYWGQMDFGSGPHTSRGSDDVFIAKYDANGKHLWSQGFGGSANDRAYDITVDGSGDIIVTGYFGGWANFGGEILKSAGLSDVFVAKYDADGSHLWSEGFGDSESEEGHKVAVDESGNVVVTGVFEGTVDFAGAPLASAGDSDVFVAKLDANGNHLWSRGFGTTSRDRGWGITFDRSGNVLVTGDFRGTIDFGGGPMTNAGLYDIFLASFDPSGNHRWSKRFGSIHRDGGFDVAVDDSGDIILTGRFTNSVDFGGGPLTSVGDDDIFIAKFREPTTAVTLRSFDSRWTGRLVEISWLLSEMGSELSFDVSRKERPEDSYELVQDPRIKRTGDRFVFEDRLTRPHTTYHYRVVVLEKGEPVTSFETQITTPPALFQLHPNRPNPFNPMTRIDFSVDRDTRVILAVYDVAGRWVRTLVDAPRPAGTHSITWNGRDHRHIPIASGIYTILLTADGQAQKQRAVLLK